MNGNLKKIIAIALTISAFNAVMPATNFNLITTRAYASTNELTSLKLETSGGSTIKTYSDNDYKSKNEVDDGDIKVNNTYYAKTSSSKIQINTSGASYVRVFKGTSSSNKGFKTSNNISLSSGTNNIIVRVYSEDPGTVKYSDTSKKVSEYTIKVKCTKDSEDDNSDDDVYLKSVSLSDGDISFSKKTYDYNINVAESVDEVKITAKPDCDSDSYDDYEVTIDGSTVDEDGDFKKTVSLNKGKNEIELKVNDSDDNKRTYTLNITRASASSTSTSTVASTTTMPSNATTVVTTTAKTSQWIQTNGIWQYNDSTGNPVKNMWVQNYYLQTDGSMATGWLSNNGGWYYLGSDGAKKTGWQSANGNWYYLDSQGLMQTGWMKDNNGKYYYLNSNGSMASNTTIGLYKLGADGAWLGK